MYHGLEEAESLRALYAQSLAVGGPSRVWASLSHNLRSASKELLKDLEDVKEAFDAQDYHRADTVLSKLRKASTSGHTHTGRETPSVDST